jgi:hypothetical protein
LRWQNFLLDWCTKQLPSWATPTFRMRRNLEANHILLMGDSGSGKSSAIRQILGQIAQRGETAIVYDPALEFTPEFYSPERGDLILNPLEVELERLKESRSAGLIGGKKQYTLEITTQPLVMASEIAGLEPLHGYIKLENVVRARFPYVAPIEKQPRFVERTVSVSPRAVAVQQAAVNSQQAASAGSNEPPKKPVQKQMVFPGSARQKAGNEKPREWDESEWIE